MALMDGPPSLPLLERNRLLKELDQHRATLRARIQEWARGNGLLRDHVWRSHIEHSDTPPNGCVDLLVCESLQEDIRLNEDSFLGLFEGLPLWFEYMTNCDLGIFVNDDSDLHDAGVDRLSHEWFAQLVAPDLATVHAGVFEHFAKDPDRISSLQWRALEELVGAIFEANGFLVKLGSGHADQGVDLRLIEHSVYGDLLTTVQVKSGKSPVRLHYVQALAAAGQLEGAYGSLFVSSSRFLPGVKKWAEHWNRESLQTLQLATSSEVAEWCGAAAGRIWMPTGVLQDPVPRGSGPLVGKILTAPNLVRFCHDRYALVLRQTQRAVLLRRIGTTRVSGDAFIGSEVPTLPSGPLSPDELFAARRRRSADEAKAWYWADDEGVYSEWDGQPSCFNHLD